MTFLIRLRDKLKLLFLDAVILSIMPLLAVLLRFEGVIPEHEAGILRVWLLPATFIGIGIFYLFGMYHRIWHYARIRDLYAIVGAVTLFSAGKFLLLFIL